MSIVITRRNERRKLSAGLCNAAATGMSNVGVFAPIVPALLALESRLAILLF